ncbi:RNA methyltransferase [bacterium]|nr:RNA methyltransferase [bacterium]
MDRLTPKLDNIYIVLVEPKQPGNIGSCCRAMKNMGITSLRLVNPVPYLVPETFKLCYGADDLVHNAAIYTDLKSAVSDAGFVVGFTRRKGKNRKPVYWLEEVLPDIINHSQNNKIALVFGRESKGLFNDELRLCHAQAAIPTKLKFPTLNLSQAVLMVCYELFICRHSPDPTVLQFLPQGETEQMYTHIKSTLSLMEYKKKGSNDLPKRILNTLRRIFNRSGLERQETQMIHGLCSRIEKLLKK